METLKKRSSNQSKKTFEDVALKHLNAVFRAAYALCGKSADAEDLTQATFLKAIEKYHTYQVGTNCKAWLLSILRNTWIDRLRRSQYQETSMAIDEDRLTAVPENEELTWTNADDLLENFSDETVIKALNKLPSDLRLTLFLSDVELCSQAEIAEIVDIAVGTVKSRVSRARSLLKNELSNYAQSMGYKR